MRKQVRVGLVCLATFIACLVFGGGTFGSCAMGNQTDNPGLTNLAILFGVLCFFSGYAFVVTCIDFMKAKKDEP